MPALTTGRPALKSRLAGKTVMAHEPLLSRRTLLACATALPAGTAASTFTISTENDPDAVLKWYWHLLQEHILSFPEGCPNDVADAWVKKSTELEECIAGLPAHTLAGLSIKVQMLAREVAQIGVTPLVMSTVEALQRLIPTAVARDLIEDNMGEDVHIFL